jgi:DNA-binding MarR family transcriptional regulator
MSADENEDPGIPALLRGARGSYGDAIRANLAEGGFDDMPRNGSFVLGGMANHGISAGDLIRELDVSKQAASQLIDTMVLRGYLDRQVNPEDRRRLSLTVTERGRAAATAVRQAILSVDAELAGQITKEQQAGLIAGLEALASIKTRRSHRHPHSHDHHDHPHPASG